MNKRVSTGLSMLIICTLLIGTSIGAQFDKAKFKGEMIHKSGKKIISLDDRYKEFLKIVAKNKAENEARNLIKAKLKQQALTKKLRLQQLKNEEAKRIKQTSVQNISRGSETMKFILTFYTDSESENSSAGAVTCQGQSLSEGMVASNTWSLGTKIQLQGYGEVYVADTGDSNFNDSSRLDVFVARQGNENNYEYDRRVSNMGKQTVAGYVIK